MFEEPTEKKVTSAITDRVFAFSASKRYFKVYPSTLGRMLLAKEIIRQLGVNTTTLAASPVVECLRLVKEKRELCTLLISYYTLKTKDEITNPRTVKTRQGILEKNLDDDDIVLVMIRILTEDSVDNLKKECGIAREKKLLQKIQKAKESKNTNTFGGLTLWGALIDAACERYGWSFDYVVWEISYVNLVMMLADQITTVYLTDKELKKVHIPKDRVYVSGDDPETMRKIMNSGEFK